jgi:N-acylneuraminate cytidylyltransferase
MSVVAVIFARGGSRGIPGKNLADADGRTLLARAIDASRSATLVDRVLVSTDDPAIAAAAADAGAEVPFLRPAALATDESPEWLAWQHAVRWLADEGAGADVLVSVPTTAPLREPHDIDAAVTELRTGAWDAVVTVTPARRHPSFNMVAIGADGVALLAPPGDSVTRRQDAASAYDITTVAYAARTDYVAAADGLFAGRVGAVIVPDERAIDIDTPLDLEIARLLLRERRR